MKILAFIIDDKYSSKPFYQEALAEHDVIFLSPTSEYYKVDELRQELENEVNYKVTVPKFPLHYYNYNYSFKDISKVFPKGWFPDVAIFFHIEYIVLPFDLEFYPCPVVGFLIDWYVGFSTLKETVKRFDYIFATDKKGAELFKNIGFNRIEYKPLVGFSPSLHKRLPDVEKIYDLTFIGNLNHNIHIKRAHWLYRLSKLSDKYKVKIITNVYEEDYVKVLNQSKISFNLSITGSMNMRAYEAPACGSLLFMESDNLEVRDFYKDREECVLYDNKNFESLLDYYLTNDNERERIIENAYKKVQNYSYKNQIEKVLNRIKELDFNYYCRTLEPEDKRIVNCAKQVFKSAFFNSNFIMSKLKNLELNTELLNLLGIYYFNLFNKHKDSDYKELKDKALRNAIFYFNQALDKEPNNFIILYNIAYVHDKGLEDYKHAIEYYENALKIIENEENKDFKYLIISPSYDTFNIKWEQNEYENIDDFNRLQHNRKNLLLGKVLYDLGILHVKTGNLDRGLKLLNKAVNYSSEPYIVLEVIAKILYDLKLFSHAVDICKMAINYMPFNFNCWLYLVRNLEELNYFDECLKVCKEVFNLIKICPIYENVLPDFERIYNEIKKKNLDIKLNNIFSKILNSLYSDALQDINEFLKIEPNNLEGLLYKALLNLKLYGNKNDLINWIRQNDITSTKPLELLDLIGYKNVKYTYNVKWSENSYKNLLTKPYFNVVNNNPDISIKVIYNNSDCVTDFNIAYVLSPTIEINNLLKFDLILVPFDSYKELFIKKGLDKDILVCPLLMDIDSIKGINKLEISDKKELNFLYIVKNLEKEKLKNLLLNYLNTFNSEDNVSLILGILNNSYNETILFLEQFLSNYSDTPDITVIELNENDVIPFVQNASVLLWDNLYIDFIPLAASIYSIPVLINDKVLELENDNILIILKEGNFNLKQAYNNYKELIKVAKSNNDYIQKYNNLIINKDKFSKELYIYFLLKKLK